MSYKQVLQQLNSKRVSSVYVIYGTETFFMQKLQKEIINVVVPDGNEETISRYDLEETPIQDVVGDAETYPLFAERKLVIAHNPIFLTAKQQSLPFEHAVDSLFTYLENPVDYTVLVLVAPYEKLDERKKITKQLKKNSSLVDCNPPDNRSLPDWIHSFAHQEGVKLDSSVADMLLMDNSGNLDILQQEIRKYALYVGEGGTVTQEIVDMLALPNTNNTGLMLADAVMSRDLPKAMHITHDLMRKKEKPIALIALMAFQFRTLLQVKLLKQEGYTQAQIQRKVKVHPYVIQLAMSREKNYTEADIEYFFSQLTKGDQTMKRGTMDPELAFELLIYNLIVPEARS